MQPCPRQHYEATMASQKRHHSHWEENGTCSYCGSISPEMLFKAIEDGCELGPTDKDYKVYVDLIEPEPDKLKIVSAVNFDIDEERRKKEGWVPADKARMRAEGWGGEYQWMRLVRQGPIRHAKFYFQHLTKEEQHRFIDLLNTKKVKIGAPGHFYRLPFFAVRIDTMKSSKLVH